MKKSQRICGRTLAVMLMVCMTANAFPTLADASDYDGQFDYSNFGIIGSFTGWSIDLPDYAMTDYDGDGIFVGKVPDLEEGTYEFKVRCDNEWDYSWGAYEEEYDRTMQSQTNLYVEILDEPKDLYVTLDTRGDDPNLWPVSYSFEEPEPEIQHKYSITGTFNDWEDIDMTDDDGDGIYTAKIYGLEEGEYELNVRQDYSWDNYWGAYNSDVESTYKSDVNYVFYFDGSEDYYVCIDFDTRYYEKENWSISDYTLSRSDEVLSYDDFLYKVNSDGEVTIVGYTGSTYDLDIPSEINGLPVVAIDASSFSYDASVENLYIPAEVKEIKGLFNCNYLGSIVVDSNNPYFSSSGGVLFNKNKTILLNYPHAKSGSYTIPTTVKTVADNAFDSCWSLTSVKISKNVSSVGIMPFIGCGELTTITVDSNNKNYASENGVLFNKDKTDLIRCPEAKNGEYDIPNTVKRIVPCAFHNCDELTSVTIPDSLEEIPYEFRGDGYSYNTTGNVFYGCYNLGSVTVSQNNAFFSSQNGIFFNKDKTDLIFYPVTSENAYTIPDTVTTIETDAFAFSNLGRVTVPESVTTIGDYAFGYYARMDILGKAGSYIEQYASENDLYFIAYEPIVNLSFVMDSHKLVKGEPVTLVALSEGGYYSCQYSFYYKETSAKSWKLLKGFGNSQVASFTPDKSGSYDVCIKVKDELDIISKKYITVNVLAPLMNQSTVSKSEIILGESVELNAEGKDGTDFYKYAFYCKKSADKSWKCISAYGKEYAKTFTPTEVGAYDICIKVKDSNGTESKKYFTLNVKNEVEELKNTSDISGTEITLGKTATVKASATGGNGTYNYAVLYKKHTDTKWTVKQNYSTNSSVSITPDSAEVYDICVKVKDGDETIVKKYFTLTVKSGELENTSTLSAASITLGKTATVKASATGGSGSYTYAVYTKKSSETKWTENYAYSSATNMALKIAEKGTYDICVKVKDSNGKIEKKYLTLTVK